MAILFESQQAREGRQVCGETRARNRRGLRAVGALQGADNFLCYVNFVSGRGFLQGGVKRLTRAGRAPLFLRRLTVSIADLARG